ncbi:tetratricopeptide repeat protein [Candidatus Gracilibacteria bacterium]|nr:tetratricopeptide repeat protein [Candidatus Gracilibacteria bacterium]
MKKPAFWGSVIGLSLLIIGAGGWIARSSIQSLWSDIFSPSVYIENSKGIPRRISYIGRIREAKSLIEHGYFSLASVELQGAIREKPSLMEPYLLLGEVYLQTQDIQKLENLIQTLSTLFPNNPEITVLQGRKHIAEQDFQTASMLLQNASDNLSPGLHFYRAILVALQNDHQTAKRILEDLATLPVASSLISLGEDGLENAERDSNTLSQELASKVNDVLHAYKTFDDVSGGKNPHLFALLGKTLAEHNEAVLAYKFAEIALTEDVSYIDAWIVRGYANLQIGNIEEALKDLRHAYDLDPLRSQTHYFLALALDKAGKTDEAVLFFEKSLEHDFEFSDEVRWRLVELFSRQAQYDRVIELYETLLDENSEPNQYVHAMHTAIDILKRPDTALTFAERLVTEKPNDAFALNMHGWALIVNKKFVQAENELEKAKELEPNNPRTFLNLALLAEEQSAFEKAKELYKKSYEFGKEKSDETAIAITNLAAEKYNNLMSRTERPEEPSASQNPENSP